MTTFMQDLRTFLIASSSIAGALGTSDAVHYSHTPEQSTRPFIWYRISQDNVPLTLDGVGLLHEAALDMELVGDSETAAQDLADKVLPKLHGYKGTAGNATVQGMFLEDKDDQYVPRNAGADDGRSVIAYNLRAFYTT